MKRTRGFKSLSLRYQVALGVALGILLFFGLFSYVSFRLAPPSTDGVYPERVKLAKITAASVDDLIRHSITHLEAAAQWPEVQADNPGEQMEALERVRNLFGNFYTLSLWSPQGQRLLAFPDQEAEKEGLDASALVREAVLFHWSVVGQAPVAQAHPPVAVVAVPIKGPQGAVAKVLVGSLHFFHLEQDLMAVPMGGPTFTMVVIDQQGRVLGSTEAERRGEMDPYSPLAGAMDPHYPLLKDLIDRKEAGAKLHDAPGGGHLVTYAPMGILPGGVIIEELQDVALLLPRQLRQTTLVLGALALVVLSIGAWMHAQYVVRPIAGLERATRRIASGAMEEPVVSHRTDEVGMLARSFEAMRVQLQKAHLERLSWEKELGERVKQRTQEVHQLLEKIISAQEEERKRLARELHDEAAQALAALLVSVQALQDSLPQGREKQLLERALVQGQQALRDLRRLILDLRPSALDDLGFVSALRSYTQDRLVSAGVRVHFELEGEERRLSPPVETALFRILQEAANNIAKHAQARNAYLRLRFTDGSFIAQVEDDGRGFDLERLEAAVLERSVGLQGMKERADLIGAGLKIHSQPGQGTRVRVELSLGPREVQGGQDPDTPG